MKGVLVGVAAVLVTLLALAGCGGGDEEGQAEGGGGGGASVVNVELGEYFVNLDVASAAAGEVTFNVSNTGEIPHEFIVYRSDEDPGSLAVANDQAQLEEDNELGEIESEDLGPGASGSLTVTLEAGNYILLCNIPTHYAQGQYAGFAAE